MGYYLSFNPTQSRDLRGLEEDIKEKVVSSISLECDCPFDTSALSYGSLYVGHHVFYSGQLHGTSGLSAMSAVEMLEESIKYHPGIYFHGADLFLNVRFNY